jgi:hypothetical protein
MSLRRLRPAECLVGVAAVALAVSLFLTWYAVGAGGGSLAVATNGWEAFAVIDVLLALTSLMGLALVVAQASRRSPGWPVALGVLTTACGLLATLLVALRILDEPGPDRAVEVRAGAWVALAAAAALTAGGWWSMRDERSPGAPEPRIEVRPAPPAAG